MTNTNKEFRDRALAVLIATAESQNTPPADKITAAQAVLWAVQETPFGIASIQGDPAAGEVN